LAAEVVSPNDSADEVQAKVTDYLAAGARLVWVVHPKTKTVTEYKSLDEVRVLTEDDSLDGGDVVPGFSMKVRDLFA
jgi:Uma2 family endonuclease